MEPRTGTELNQHRSELEPALIRRKNEAPPLCASPVTGTFVGSCRHETRAAAFSLPPGFPLSLLHSLSLSALRNHRRRHQTVGVVCRSASKFEGRRGVVGDDRRRRRGMLLEHEAPCLKPVK
ncbi:hypothetical protein Hanom_Chr11g01016771 [Helianthus anomalus]